VFVSASASRDEGVIAPVEVRIRRTAMSSRTVGRLPSWHDERCSRHVGRLIYGTIASLDGYIEDEAGGFGWAEPDAEVHGFVNDLQRTIGTHLYGRRLYETMAVWETDASFAEQSPEMRDFAESWQAAEKIVYSRTLEAVSTQRTRIEREFDPEAVRRLKEATGSDLLVGGAALAAEAFRAGLVDECQLFLVPVIVGGGKRALPDAVRLRLELLDEHRFGNGTVFLRYGAAPTGG
jgi:dihydrofolate reductase